MAGGVNPFDPVRRTEDILKVLDVSSKSKIEGHIEFYEKCVSRKNDPFLPTYRRVLQRLREML